MRCEFGSCVSSDVLRFESFPLLFIVFLSPYDGINRIRFTGSSLGSELSADYLAPLKRFHPQRTRRRHEGFFVDKLIDEFSPLQFAVAAKVDEKANFQACSLEVIQNL